MSIKELQEQAFQEWQTLMTNAGVTIEVGDIVIRLIFNAGYLAGRVNGLETAMAIQKGEVTK